LSYASSLALCKACAACTRVHFNLIYCSERLLAASVAPAPRVAPGVSPENLIFELLPSWRWSARTRGTHHFWKKGGVFNVSMQQERLTRRPKWDGRGIEIWRVQ
jgi:hypothetical protein